MTKSFFPTKRGRVSTPLRPAWSVLLLSLLLASTPAYSQTFDSGSDGSDGPLNLTEPGTIIFDPRSFDPPLDSDGDNVYHFTTINIGEGVTVHMRAPELSWRPVVWLAAGAVQINGMLDLSGEEGHKDVAIAPNRRPAVPGPGGFSGGSGNSAGAVLIEGYGPGGGNPLGRNAGGGGHRSDGGSSPGTAYGNNFLVPLLGGSGGAGSNNPSGAGGGAGGGALLIAASTAIAVNGTIQANGGKGGDSSGATGSKGGGGGSGGSIHLKAINISGSGMLRASGGSGGSGQFPGHSGSVGRIRLEAVDHSFTGTSTPSRIPGTPTPVILPTNLPSVQVVSIAGIAVPPSPTGSFTTPDVTFDGFSNTPVEIEARNVPADTIVKVHVFSENGDDQIVDSTPLAGTLERSTATATITFPPGFSRGFARATWEPPAP